MSGRPVRLLTVAGSDSGGGAGIQADLKTFAAHGVYGMSAVTALTAQNTLGVHGILQVPAEFVAAQIDAVFADLGVDGVKVGMLGTAAVARVVAERLAAHGTQILVVDPVMIAASGDPLLEPDAIEELRRGLFAMATLITPNLPEAETLLDVRASSIDERVELARALGRETRAVLLKGAHAPGDEVVDLLWDGRTIHLFRHPRLATRAGHGTGCTLASSIAARLAAGSPLEEACRSAIAWLEGALRAAPDLGSGHGPVDHLWEASPRWARS